MWIDEYYRYEENEDAGPCGACGAMRDTDIEKAKAWGKVKRQNKRKANSLHMNYIWGWREVTQEERDRRGRRREGERGRQGGERERDRGKGERKEREKRSGIPFLSLPPPSTRLFQKKLIHAARALQAHCHLTCHCPPPR